VKLDPSKQYRMPLIMGPLFDRQTTQFRYRQVEVVAIQYLTDPEAIPPLLPDCYQRAAKPMVTVLFGYNDGLDFMAGGSYRIAAVEVAARFEGEHDHTEGDYILVMFEDQTWPIIGGREDLGVPKLYADISPIKILSDGRLRCEASLWGHLLFGIDLAPPKKQNTIVRMVANRTINARPWLAYKYIPSLDGPPDADYPTITQNDTKIDELWFSKSGTVFFGDAAVRDVGHGGLVVDALRTLPIVELDRALYFRGSAVLRYDLSRRLR
jgi:acetoacetate decarboxylase